MSTSQVCPECNSTNIITENFVYVCADCGNVINNNIDSVLDKAVKNSGTTIDCNRISVKNQIVANVCRNYTSSINPRLTAPVKECIEVINNTCKNLNIPNYICKMAIELFKTITKEQHFKAGTRNVKLCLAISCIYLVSNREGNSITLTELWKSTDFIFDHFGIIFMRLEKQYPKIYPNKSKNIETLVPFYVFKLNIDAKEKPSIIDIATNLVWMWREALLVQGYNPIYVIYSAIYFAWKAVNLDRCKVNVNKFCATVGIDFKRTIRERINFYEKELKNFYSSSPMYANEDLTPVTIVCKLKELLKNKRTILFNYKPPLLKDQTNKRKELEDQESFDENSYKKLQYYDIQTQENDDDISDSEINEYIRTGDEIRQITDLAHMPDG